MPVCVAVETKIAAPASKIAAFAGNPDNAPKWYVNIKSAEWQTAPDLKVGARIAFVAHFLGKRMAYTYEIVDLVPDQRLVMRTHQGPFPMETTYEWFDLGDGYMHMRLQNQGEPKGFSKLMAPLMKLMMRKAMRVDLAKLKQLMEA